MEQKMLDELRRPFHPSDVIWKPGAVKGDRALALAYADLRAYMNRLDEVCGGEWSVSYEPWGPDRIICKLTIAGVSRSSTGETTNESEKSEIGGTVAEAQSFKRACAMFGLGRYLYNLPSGWYDFDPSTKRFTDQAKAKLTAILTQHYRKAAEGNVAPPVANPFEDAPPVEPTPTLATAEQVKTLNALGLEFYGEDEWKEQLPKIVEAVSTGAAHKAEDLKPREAEKLIDGIKKRIDKAAMVAPFTGSVD